MDNLSGKRVKKDGMKGNIYNNVSVGVNWDNGSMYPVRLADLEFIENTIKAGHGLKPTTTRPKPNPRPKPYKY